MTKTTGKISGNKLTEKEEEIMLLFWQHGALCVKEILELMPEPRPHVNTVSTFVRALEAKGFLSHEQSGNGFRYFAIKPIDDYRRRTVGEMIRSYFNNSYKSAVCSLVEDEKLSLGELRELIELMESRCTGSDAHTDTQSNINN